MSSSQLQQRWRYYMYVFKLSIRPSMRSSLIFHKLLGQFQQTYNLGTRVCTSQILRSKSKVVSLPDWIRSKIHFCGPHCEQKTLEDDDLKWFECVVCGCTILGKTRSKVKDQSQNQTKYSQKGRGIRIDGSVEFYWVFTDHLFSTSYNTSVLARWLQRSLFVQTWHRLQDIYVFWYLCIYSMAFHKSLDSDTSIN